MSFYPILSAPGCSGWTTLYNFAPNNWEERDRRSRFFGVTWSDGAQWQSRTLGSIGDGEARTIRALDLADLVPAGCMPLLWLRDAEAPRVAAALSLAGMPATSYPNWRATLGLSSEGGATTCYQGEIDPFPAPGSLLTFGHFLQFGTEVENYLLLLNIEASPVARVARLEIRDAAAPGVEKAVAEVRSNSVSVVPLNMSGMIRQDLPLLLCRQMSGIPLYFSRLRDGSQLSLEHTHPPASSVVHGRRWEAQKLLKGLWFGKAGPV